MLSVGMFTYSTRPRGSVVHAASLADELARKGHDVTLYALGQPGASLYRPVACNVMLFPAGEAPADKDALVRQRVGEFASGLKWCALRHDVLHAQDCLAASALLEAAVHGVRKARNVPIVRTVHHVERFESPYLAECQRRSVVEADEVFAVSRLTQREVASEFGRASRLVTNGVEASRFAEAQRDRSWLRERFGVDEHDAVILSVGGVEPRKNARRALAAVALAQTAHPELSWIIAGGSSLWDHSGYAREFEADLAQMPEGLRRRIVRTGLLDEDAMSALYGLADVLLLPSLKEGFGLCVLEAMAAGTAVIVPQEEPFTEYLDARSATFVDPCSIEGIARALADLLADPVRRGALVREARDRARSFTWSHSASLHLAHYEALLSRGASEARAHA